jgi:hypothetical protein
MAWDEPDLTEEEEIIQGIVIEDIGGTYREMLQEVGFQHVEMTEFRDIPAYAMLWLMNGLDAAGKQELHNAIRHEEGPRFWYVATEVGNFAVFLTGPGSAFLDLTICQLYAYQLDEFQSGSDSRMCKFTSEHGHRLLSLLQKNWQ